MATFVKVGDSSMEESTVTTRIIDVKALKDDMRAHGEALIARAQSLAQANLLGCVTNIPQSELDSLVATLNTFLTIL